MTTAVAEAPRLPVSHACLACNQVDDHPKIHVLYGKNLATGVPDWAHLHHDCLGDTGEMPALIARWRDELLADASGEGERLRAIVEQAANGRRGTPLRGWIEEFIPTIGTGPTAATTGLDVAIGNAGLDALHTATSATFGALTITGPINIRAMSAIGATDAAAGTEITTGNSYTSGGAGLGAPAWAAAATVANIASKSTNAVLNKTNMPARTIVALEEYDVSGTPKRILRGAVTSLTTNSGDTVSIASGALTDTFA